MRALASLFVLALVPGVASAQRPARPAQVARPAPAAKAAPQAAAAAPAATTPDLHLEQTGIGLIVPAGWTSEATGAETFVLLGPDGVTTLMLFGVPAKDMEGAMKDLKRLVSGKVTAVKLEPTKDGRVGGMPAVMADGKGQVDGHDVDLGVMLVLNEARQRVLFLVGFTLPGKGDYGKDLADMLNSVHTAE